MAPRTIKQLIYGLFFLSVVLVVVLLVYFVFFSVHPSCFDGKQNQNEESVDCGGVCRGACIPTLRPLEGVGEVKVFFPDQEHVSLFAQMQNPNTDFAARRFSYVIRIYPQKGGEPVEFSGASYIYAGEIKYLVRLEPLPPELSGRAFQKAEFAVTDEVWIPAAQLRRPRFRIQSQNTILSRDGIEVTGVVVNDDTVGFSDIEIVAILFNGQNRAIAMTYTILAQLSSHDSTSFKVLHPPVTGGVNAAATEIFVTAPQHY